MSNPETFFKKLTKEHLLSIAEYRDLPVASVLKDDPKTDLARMVADDVSSYGLQLLVQSLDREILDELAEEHKLEYPGYDFSKTGKPSSKLIAKRLVVRMKEEGAKSFLSQQDNLAKIVEDLELEGVSSKDKDKAAKAVLAEADRIGMENCLSAFTTDKLIAFAEDQGIKIYGRSHEKILQALIERKSMSAPAKKTKVKAPKKSESEPKIAKGITSVDLNSWFYRDDLSKWCEDKGLPKNGSKKELVKRILDHFAGKDVSAKPKGKKKAAPKKTTATKGTKRKAEEKPAEESKNKKQKTQ